MSRYAILGIMDVSTTGSVRSKGDNMAYEMKHLIRRWIKSDIRNEEFRVATATTGQKTFLDIRVWYTDKDGQKQPGKGVAIPIEDDNVDELLKAVKEVESLY